MLNPADIMDFCNLLDTIDSVSIEENNNGEDVTLNDIKSVNSGNNCLHYILMHNNHRIVIQTYKAMNRRGDLDIVQGKPELEEKFQSLIQTINSRPQDYTDERLNKLFVLYCGIWQKCSAYLKVDNKHMCDFGPDISVIWANGWLINVDDINLSQIEFVNTSQIQLLLDFIVTVEDICR